MGSENRIFARLAFVCFSIYVSALLAVRLQSGILSIVVIEHLDMITTSSVTDSLSLSAEHNSPRDEEDLTIFLSLYFSRYLFFSLPLSLFHVTLSTVSDTMITSADEASHFATLRTKSTLS
eukprot:sb/3476098/